jgi:hypothetical protein
MNTPTLINVLNTHYNSASKVSTLQLLLPSMPELIIDEIISIVNVFSWSDDRKTVLELLIPKLKPTEVENNTIATIDKIMSIGNLDILQVLNLLADSNKLKNVLQYKFIDKYIKRFIKSDDYLKIVTLVPCDIFEFLDTAVTLHYFTEEIILKTLKSKFDKNVFNTNPQSNGFFANLFNRTQSAEKATLEYTIYVAQKLSSYFNDYKIYTEVCEYFGIEKDLYEKNKAQIDQMNKTIITFGELHTIAEFTKKQRYEYTKTINNKNCTAQLTVKSDSDIYYEFSYNTKGGSGSSSSSISTNGGVECDEDGFHNIKNYELCKNRIVV